jgi:primosomal protein N' (replication factor Y)
VGAGTQRIEESLKELFPKARILRADRDTLTNVEEMQTLLKTMAGGDADILLGTQTVTKGLDLPRVTLAAVLVADIGMSLPHFRAGERTFQLLMQLTGRSGRHAPGEVIIQTFRPDALEVRAAATHDASTYLDAELRLRLAMGYPPAVGMARLIFRGERPKERAHLVKALLEASASRLGVEASVSAGPTFFSGGKEWHILIRSNSYRALLEAIKLEDVVVDIEPLETL